MKKIIKEILVQLKKMLKNNIINSFINFSICVALFFNTFFIRKVYANDSDLIILSAGETPGIYDEDFYDLDYSAADIKKAQIWDPFEKLNRKTHKFNDFLLKNVARPFYYDFYLKVTSHKVRKTINNIVTNLEMPMRFLNYTLQLDFDGSARSLYSFIMNTTYGVFGIFDVATEQDIIVPNTDFGITLAKYNVPAGPYIVLPFLGPNDLRGTFSLVTESIVDPFGFNAFDIARDGTVLNREQLIIRVSLIALDDITFVMENFYDLIESSFDSYVVIRDAYGQSQEYKIKNVKGK